MFSNYSFRFLVIAITITLFANSSAYACSSFQLKAFRNSYIGKSYDWKFGDGYIIYNPKSLEKFSLSLKPDSKNIKWTSKYSSLTYNQYGLDFPNGGMNEKGLTVEVLWLDESIFPAKDEKATLNELQWIQYALDTQKTTAGVIKTLNTVRIEPVYAMVHYFVCDIKKNCATIEFVNGKAVVSGYEKYRLEAITNSTHKDSTSFLGLFKNFGGTYDVTYGIYGSLDRFVRVNEYLRTYNKTIDPLSYAFEALDSVKRAPVHDATYTQWQIVNDKKRLLSHFKTAFGESKMGSVSLKKFPKECANRYYFDLKNPARGNINDQFLPLPFEVNYALVNTTLKKVMPNAPEQMVQAIAGAPFKFTCLQ